MRSLKDRLERVESLLKTAGILHEDDMTINDFSDDEVEVLDERWDARHQRPESSGMSSNRSSTTQESWSHDVENYAGGGDIEATSIFRQHEQDDSRYFGRSPAFLINRVWLTETEEQGDHVHCQFSPGVESSG